MKRILFYCIIASATLCGSCSDPSRKLGGGNSDSSESQVSLQLPDRNQFDDNAKSKLTGIHVIIEALQDGCNGFTTINTYSQWSSSNISQSIRKNCDYSVGVELGPLDPTSSSLTAVYFTNWNGPKQGQLLKKESVTQDTVSITVSLRITQAATNAGLSVADLQGAISTGNNGTITGPVSPGDYDYTQHIQWGNVAAVAWSGQNYGSEHYQDVMSHCTDPAIEGDPPMTAHESTHGINAYMRNLTPANDQFVYWANGEGAYILEPNLGSTATAAYVPASAQQIASLNYNLYVIQQAQAWSNFLYLFDEWSAYVTQGKVAVEMLQSGNSNVGSDNNIDGAMDLLYFCSATAIAFSLQDPSEFNGNEQFRAVYVMFAEGTVALINQNVAGSQLHASQLLQDFVTAPDNDQIRQFLKTWIGAGWTQRVLGF